MGSITARGKGLQGGTAAASPPFLSFSDIKPIVHAPTVIPLNAAALQSSSFLESLSYSPGGCSFVGDTNSSQGARGRRPEGQTALRTDSLGAFRACVPLTLSFLVCVK